MFHEPVGPFEIFSWSIAGNETCISVRANNMCFAFDLGFAPTPLVACDHVFISHGHADHVGAIAQHMKKRSLNKLPKAVYFMPPHLVEPVSTICKSFAQMSEKTFDASEFDCRLVSIEPGSRLPLTSGWSVEAIPTSHAVKSQGYLLYHRRADGVDHPEIAYLGDSRFSVLIDAQKHIPALLSTRLLIMEATFLDKPDRLLSRATEHGHTHLDELRRNSKLFYDIEFIYLVHFSARYTVPYILRLIQETLPSWLASRVIPSVCAQQCLSTQ